MPQQDILKTTYMPQQSASRRADMTKGSVTHKPARDLLQDGECTA